MWKLKGGVWLPALGLLNGGIDSKSRGTIRSIELERRRKFLDLLLLTLGKLLRILARGEAGDVGGGGKHGGGEDDWWESKCSRECLELRSSGWLLLVWRICLTNNGGNSWFRGNKVRPQFGRWYGFGEVCGNGERHFSWFWGEGDEWSVERWLLDFGREVISGYGIG